MLLTSLDFRLADLVEDNGNELVAHRGLLMAGAQEVTSGGHVGLPGAGPPILRYQPIPRAKLSAVRHTVASFAAMLHQEGLVIIGETHGTNEFPRLVWELASTALERGPVRMAIEQDAGGQAELDRYMDSDGGQLATERLLSADVWQAGDGRGSLAVLDLIDRCRRLRAAGLPMDVRFVDMGLSDVGMGPPNSTRRDQVIAERLAAESSSSAAVVALLGSVHARTDAHLRSQAEPGFRPAAAILRHQMTALSLLGVHGGGKAWCIRMHDGKPLSGAHLFRGRELGPEPFFDLRRPSPVMTALPTSPPSRPQHQLSTVQTAAGRGFPRRGAREPPARHLVSRLADLDPDTDLIFNKRPG